MPRRKKFPQILDLPQGINRRGQPLNLGSLAHDFEEHLKHSVKNPKTIGQYMGYVRRFVEYAGNVEPDQISEELVRAYFTEISRKGKAVAMVVGQFLRFVDARLPARVLGSAPPPKSATKNNGELVEPLSIGV